MRAVGRAISILSLIGIGISGYSLYNHYQPAGESFCNFSDRFNCDVVNKSVYSKVAGIPVAVVGVVGYAVLLSLSSLRLSMKGRASFPFLLLVFSWAGFLFSLYLTYVELFILGAVCILCVLSFIIITAIAVLATVGYIGRGKGRSA